MRADADFFYVPKASEKHPSMKVATLINILYSRTISSKHIVLEIA
jgi:hypothetical protein